jgi:DNA invertase Pin-like site-specific DNA recombinase
LDAQKIDLPDSYGKLARNISKPTHTLRAEEITQLIMNYEQDGLMTKELVKKYHISRDYIHRILTSNGVKLRRIRPATRGKEAEIVRLYQSGMSTNKIAKKFGISQSPVITCLHGQDIQMRPAGRPRQG